MRKIRYRVWNRKQKQLSPVKSIHMDVNGTVHIVSPEWGASPLLPGSFDLMQYTGLKDKNGVAIFEGDIITVPVFGHPLPYAPSIEVGITAYEVFWDTICLTWGLRECECPSVTTNENLCDYDESDMGVVGNIHEAETQPAKEG